MTQGADRILEIADPVHGGLQGAPKFPLGYQAEFLMHYAKVQGDGRSLFYVELTLEKMSRGGIYDQLGGGFSRYAVDEEWLTPHFEKMLYDNAILAQTYLAAWKMTKKEAYAAICRQTLHYIIRDMTHPEGGFFFRRRRRQRRAGRPFLYMDPARDRRSDPRGGR